MASTHCAPSEWTDAPPAWVRPYLRIPYAERDCWQLCAFVTERETGRQLPLFDLDYAHTLDESVWAASNRRRVDRIVRRELPRWRQVEKPEPFDIALYRVGGSGWHTALVAGGGWALNTDATHGSRAIRLQETEWLKRFDGYYRHE